MKNEILVVGGFKDKTTFNSKNLSTKSHSFLKLNPYENFKINKDSQNLINPFNIKNVY